MYVTLRKVKKLKKKQLQLSMAIYIFVLNIVGMKKKNNQRNRGYKQVIRHIKIGYKE